MNKETIETFTIEKYKKMKAGNATDGAIISQLGTYPAKFIAWKRENGLMEVKTVQDTHIETQEFVQQTEDSKPTVHADSVERTKYDALWTKHKTLQVEHDLVVNALEETKRFLKEEQETVSAIDKECAAHEKQYTDLIEERNNLFDQLADDKREYERVIHALQDRLDNLNSIEGYYRESEVNYRNLRCQVHALQEENADLQGMKQLAKMLAKEFVKEDAE